MITAQKYYERKKKEKVKCDAFLKMLVKCKIIGRVFYVINRQTIKTHINLLYCFRLSAFYHRMRNRDVFTNTIFCCK
jgi:hypothetical protein